jgi:hypothetical protein
MNKFQKRKKKREKKVKNNIKPKKEKVGEGRKRGNDIRINEI